MRLRGVYLGWRVHRFSQLSKASTVLARGRVHAAALLGAGVVIFGAAAAYAQDDTAFHELETKYIFGSFTIGSATGIEGEKEFEAEFRSVLIDRGALPFAVTLAIEPEFHSLDETSGATVINYGLETKLQADAELIKNRLYLGFNLLYEPETTHNSVGSWDDESTIGGSVALAW